MLHLFQSGAAVELLRLDNPLGGSETSNKIGFHQGANEDGYIDSHYDATNGWAMRFGTRNAGNSAADRMIITNNGNVGIGTTFPSPNGSLTLSRNQPSGYGQLFLDSPNTSGNIRTGFVLSNNLAYRWIIGNDLNLNGTNDFFVYDGPSNQTRMYINTAGNVGIGTTSPQTKLHVNTTASADGLTIDGTTNPAITFRNTGVVKGYIGMATGGGAYFTGANASDLILRSETNNVLLGSGSGTPALTVSNGGGVGVGTTTPGAKLHVDSGVAGINELRLGTGLSGQSSENRISFALGAGGSLLAQISGLKNTANDLTSIRLRTIDGQYILRDRMTIDYVGHVGIGTATPAQSAMLDVNGNVNVTGDVTATGNINAKYQDLAEWVFTGEVLAPGTVVVLNRQKNDEVVPSSASYDTGVAGVVSAQPGIILGVPGPLKARIATTGRVRVHVDASRAAIRIGDLLVTSDHPGLAMKSEPLDLGGVKIHRPGTLIGKALEPLASGEGEILVLLSLQ
jgi:hypothetical protein